MQLVRKFLKNEDGAIIAEYGLLLAMVAVTLVAVVTLFGGNISTWFKAQVDHITTQGV
jgi:Flp pilus assembly pilin Flp